MANNVQTIVIDNLGGRLTRYDNGNINSGFAKYDQTFGMDPFSKPGQLIWQEAAIQIDSAGSVITDLIMAGKERVESGISYVYAIGHNARLYKIQINDPGTQNPNYDTPVLLATLSSQSPTFTRGAFIEFFGSTERIYIGHDKGVTRIDFDGMNETFIGSAGSYTATVPRPLKQFLGNLYFGNGENIGEITSAAAVSTYSKLSPGFPSGTQVRDLDVSIDGNYLQIVVSRLPLPDLTAITQDTAFIANSESYIFKWNGIDTGYTAFDTYPSFSLNANLVYSAHQYIFGYDIAGGTLYGADGSKILSLVQSQAPLPSAIGSNGNQLGWATIEPSGGVSKGSIFIYGKVDEETPSGHWRQLLFSASGDDTEVIRIPFATLVSNLFVGPVSNGYTNGVVGVSKGYFSTLEIDATPTAAYKFFKWYPFPIGFGAPASGSGVYETQSQIFSKKFTVKEVRVYGEPWVANNSFKVDLIGSNGGVITNSTATFTVGTNLTAGDDIAEYNPQIAPTYSLAVRLTNLGTVNHTINKVELDVVPAGK